MNWSEGSSMSMRIPERIAAMDWALLHEALDEQGYACLPPLLRKEECRDLIGLYDEEERFRSRIDMAKYRFGIGEYKYFQSPLPPLIQELRTAFYPELGKAANRWRRLLGQEASYPAELSDFLAACHRHMQVRSTPLILKYETGGYNCLHQDLYGEMFFPFQVVLMLNEKGTEYTGGEFLLVEQRPRAQSRGHVLSLGQGAGVIFPTQRRPAAGKRGYHQHTIRHGVSTITSGARYSIGIIFHDAE
jgi:uncharacterized protein